MASGCCCSWQRPRWRPAETPWFAQGCIARPWQLAWVFSPAAPSSCSSMASSSIAPWDFGRLLGVYVALFFLVAQVINWAAFGIAPAPRIYLGGALIVSGAMVITFWQSS